VKLDFIVNESPTAERARARYSQIPVAAFTADWAGVAWAYARKNHVREHGQIGLDATT
jgi:hypothetical protein